MALLLSVLLLVKVAFLPARLIVMLPTACTPAIAALVTELAVTSIVPKNAPVPTRVIVTSSAVDVAVKSSPTAGT